MTRICLDDRKDIQEILKLFPFKGVCCTAVGGLCVCMYSVISMGVMCYTVWPSKLDSVLL